MRGQWDNEQPTSPTLMRSALALIGGFLALTAVILMVIAAGNIFAGNYVAAAMQIAAGIAFPFAMWMGLKMLADILTVLNRSHDRLEALEERLAGPTTVDIETTPLTPAGGPVESPAADDGPAYPDAET
ncbi:MAG TPA: hypothetical protein VG942_17025 [Hyphomonadaceae bacterium]|nr:hypothetical protein [Hyphomonadaceae bacterium]